MQRSLDVAAGEVVVVDVDLAQPGLPPPTRVHVIPQQAALLRHVPHHVNPIDCQRRVADERGQPSAHQTDVERVGERFEPVVERELVDEDALVAKVARASAQRARWHSPPHPPQHLAPIVIGEELQHELPVAGFTRRVVEDARVEREERLPATARHGVADAEVDERRRPVAKRAEGFGEEVSAPPGI